jgi:hypothetical protein
MRRGEGATHDCGSTNDDEATLADSDHVGQSGHSTWLCRREAWEANKWDAALF